MAPPRPYSYTHLGHLPTSGSVSVYGVIVDIRTEPGGAAELTLKDRTGSSRLRLQAGHGTDSFLQNCQMNDVLRIHRSNVIQIGNSSCLSFRKGVMGNHAIVWDKQAGLKKWKAATADNNTVTDEDWQRVEDLRTFLTELRSTVSPTDSNQDDFKQEKDRRFLDQASGKKAPYAAPQARLSASELEKLDSIVAFKTHTLVSTEEHAARNSDCKTNRYFNYFAQVLAVYRMNVGCVLLRLWDATPNRTKQLARVASCDVEATLCSCDASVLDKVSDCLVDLFCWGETAADIAEQFKPGCVILAANIHPYVRRMGESCMTMHEIERQSSRSWLMEVPADHARAIKIGKRCADKLRELGCGQPFSTIAGTAEGNQPLTSIENTDEAAVAHSTPIAEKNEGNKEVNPAETESSQTSQVDRCTSALYGLLHSQSVQMSQPVPPVPAGSSHSPVGPSTSSRTAMKQGNSEVGFHDSIDDEFFGPVGPSGSAAKPPANKGQVGKKLNRLPREVLQRELMEDFSAPSPPPRTVSRVRRDSFSSVESFDALLDGGLLESTTVVTIEQVRAMREKRKAGRQLSATVSNGNGAAEEAGRGPPAVNGKDVGKSTRSVATVSPTTAAAAIAVQEEPRQPQAACPAENVVAVQPVARGANVPSINSLLAKVRNEEELGLAKKRIWSDCLVSDISLQQEMEFALTLKPGAKYIMQNVSTVSMTDWKSDSFLDPLFWIVWCPACKKEFNYPRKTKLWCSHCLEAQKKLQPVQLSFRVAIPVNSPDGQIQMILCVLRDDLRRLIPTTSKFQYLTDEQCTQAYNAAQQDHLWTANIAVAARYALRSYALLASSSVVQRVQVEEKVVVLLVNKCSFVST